MKKPRDVTRFPFGHAWVALQWIVLAALLFYMLAGLRGQEMPHTAIGSAAPVSLTLRRAIDLALAPDGNARVAIAREMVEEAKARQGQTRADLLPNLDGAMSQSSQTRNLQAFGIQIAIPVPGFEQPRFVGPFDVFDARLSATQTLFSMSAIRRYQASRATVSAAQAEEEYARQTVSAAVARAYFQALRTQAQRQAAEANLQLALELEQLAQNLKNAGTGLAVEVTRAAVQRSQAEQTLMVRETELRAARLQLLRAIGLPMTGEFVLTDEMENRPAPTASLGEALRQAEAHRPDWKSQEARLKNARLLSSATKWERAPSVAAFGDYGSSGSSVGNSLPTRAVGVQMRVPVFDGGRRDARRAEASARVREEEYRARDLRQQIELEVRLAFDALASARDQVAVAQEALAQAERELDQARRRYQAGVTNSLELTRAQTTVEQARSNKIDSLFRYNAARIDLAQATGEIASAIP
jgi:outer membrane protein TolC